MIFIIIDDKIKETGFYKIPTLHNFTVEDKIICQIRKANVFNFQKFLVGKEYIKDESLELNTKGFSSNIFSAKVFLLLLGNFSIYFFAILPLSVVFLIVGWLSYWFTFLVFSQSVTLL
jgi:hypothetical protein